jgi:hypothetical protein
MASWPVVGSFLGDWKAFIGLPLASTTCGIIAFGPNQVWSFCGVAFK